MSNTIKWQFETAALLRTMERMVRNGNFTTCSEVMEYLEDNLEASPVEEAEGELETEEDNS